MRFQQLTAPVTAKGVEDTAFYRSVRLVALNEVGGDPARFGTSVDEFHRQNARRAAHHPRAMLATATHDMKRGEDVRARLAAISEVPDQWRRALARWSRLNRKHRGIVTPLDEYLLYQTILGAWPAELLAAELDADGAGAVHRPHRGVRRSKPRARRSCARAGRTRTPQYEPALRRVRDARSSTPSARRRFSRACAPARAASRATGMTNGLAQAVLKATAPGVPDTYQGTELWDLSLVDPDNRRPVDFAARAAALRALDDGARARDARARRSRATCSPRGRTAASSSTCSRRCCAIAPRRGWPDDAYAPLAAHGERAAHVVAFARGAALVVVPRLPRTLSGDAAAARRACGATRCSSWAPERAGRATATCSPAASCRCATRTAPRTLALADALRGAAGRGARAGIGFAVCGRLSLAGRGEGSAAVGVQRRRSPEPPACTTATGVSMSSGPRRSARSRRRSRRGPCAAASTRTSMRHRSPAA